jgi:Uncharacterized conserved protein
VCPCDGHAKATRLTGGRDRERPGSHRSEVLARGQTTVTRAYDKLVRDRIPEMIRADGERPVTHTVDGEAYGERLVEKLDEEVTEFADSRDPAELADVLEVLHALRTHHDLTREELAAIRERKAEARGRFERGVVLERVEE